MINKEELNALTRRRAYNQGIVDGVEALREEDLLEGEYRVLCILTL